MSARPQKIVLTGRKVVAGCIEGEALVTQETISGWGGVNPVKGTVIETRHELRGVSFKDKILVFPGAKGSSGWSAMFHHCRLYGTAPKATATATTTASGAVPESAQKQIEDAQKQVEAAQKSADKARSQAEAAKKSAEALKALGK